MSGAWNHGEPYYRCRFPSEYAGATGQHPSTVYLRESDVTSHLDAWLLSVFDPKNLDGAVAAMAAAQEPDDGAPARAEAARRAVKDCGTRLAKYRSALEAGADPAVVAGGSRGSRATASLPRASGPLQRERLSPSQRPRFGRW